MGASEALRHHSRRLLFLNFIDPHRASFLKKDVHLDLKAAQSPDSFGSGLPDGPEACKPASPVASESRVCFPTTLSICCYRVWMAHLFACSQPHGHTAGEKLNGEHMFGWAIQFMKCSIATFLAIRWKTSPEIKHLIKGSNDKSEKLDLNQTLRLKSSSAICQGSVLFIGKRCARRFTCDRAPWSLAKWKVWKLDN